MPRHPSRFAASRLALAPLLLAACFRAAPDDQDADRRPDGSDTSIDAAALGEESALSLPRLSRREYVLTLSDLVAEIAPSAAAELPALLERHARSLPEDLLLGPPAEKHGGFARLDQTQQQQYADVPFHVGLAVGELLSGDAERRQALLGDCAGAEPLSKACVSGFVQRFGALSQRRPMADDDVAFYTDQLPADGITPRQVAELIAQLLSAPRFLYHVESGQPQPGGGDDIYPLDAWELAARLSYHAWGTMPDAELRSHAASGALLDDSVYRAQVDRLYADPRAREPIERFFEQWFWPLLTLPALGAQNSDPAYRNFAGAIAPSPALTQAMVRDVLDSVLYVTEHGGSLRDLLSNQQSFAKDPQLAQIYGTPVWDGVSTPPTAPAERVGLLTRPALLATGALITRPIMKGVFIRSTLLCESIPPPPPEAMQVTIEVSPEFSTRQVVEQVTESSPSCAGCHKSMINPLGFATENFDALGRLRRTQPLFGGDGSPIGQAPVRTDSATPFIDKSSEPLQGAADLTERLLDTGKIEACMAQRYFRYAFRRVEQTSGDEALIEVLARSAQEGRPLVELLKSVVFRPEFRRKRFLP